jgi:hypothetical protein
VLARAAQAQAFQPPGAIPALVTGNGGDVRKSLNIAFTIGWRQSQGYREWMSARIPVLWNAQTGEVVPLKDLRQAPAGTWWLRRRLTLPVSSHPLFLTIPVRIGRQVLGSEKQRRTVGINSSSLLI